MAITGTVSSGGTAVAPAPEVVASPRASRVVVSRRVARIEFPRFQPVDSRPGGGKLAPPGTVRMRNDEPMRNAITDVPGIRVGQAQRVGDGWLTGVTVVVPPPAGAVAGVDVRGGGPGTRETDLLDPRNLVERVHAIVLTGGSALGLAAVDGVVQRLLAEGVGFPVGEPDGPSGVVPIVPAAVIFD